MSDESRLTSERIDEVERLAREAKERADKATPGPWIREEAQDGEMLPDGTGSAGEYYSTRYVLAVGDNEPFDREIAHAYRSIDDALFIAHAREDVPALAGALLEATAEVRRLRALDGVKGTAASELARRWLMPRLNMLARAESEDATRFQIRRSEGIAATWRVAIEDLCMAFNVPEPQPEGHGAERARELLERDKRRRRERFTLGGLQALADAGDPVARAFVNAPVVDGKPGPDEPPTGDVPPEDFIPHEVILQGLLERAKVEHDELRAEIERLRALDAEWQRVTGYSAPERFPGLTAEQREREATAEQSSDVSPEVGACPNADCPHDAWTMRGRTRCTCGAELVRAGRLARADVTGVGVDLGAGPATFDAAVLERQPVVGPFRVASAEEAPAAGAMSVEEALAWADGEIAAAGFTPETVPPLEEGPPVIRIERTECPTTGELLYRRSVPPQEAPAVDRTGHGPEDVDPRWQPGARWACHDRLFVLERTAQFQGLAWAHFVCTSMAIELGEMTPENGWRYVEPADDGRWLPGAVWQNGVHRFVLRCVDAWQGPVARFADGCWTRQEELTEANGWRFIGRAEESTGAEHVIEFRSGSFLQSLEASRGGPAETAQRFASFEAADKFIDEHEWVAFNGGMPVPLASALRKGGG